MHVNSQALKKRLNRNRSLRHLLYEEKALLAGEPWHQLGNRGSDMIPEFIT